MAASDSPSASPSVSPSQSPSSSPSASASNSPSKSPSRSPSSSPSASPSPIAAGEVTYTINSRIRIGKKMLSFVKVEFGGTSDYYPNGGIELTVNGLGMRSSIDAVFVMEDNASGYQYQWDKSAKKLRMFFSANGAVNTELDDNALTAQVLEVMAIGG